MLYNKNYKKKLYNFISTSIFSKIRCCMFISISVLIKTDVDGNKTTSIFIKNRCCFMITDIGFW